MARARLEVIGLSIRTCCFYRIRNGLYNSIGTCGPDPAVVVLHRRLWGARGTVPQVWRPSGSCVLRRPAAHREAILHER
eukprot:scaffold53363_cov38-Prasinocladus_malaysianus.AAC.1